MIFKIPHDRGCFSPPLVALLGAIAFAPYGWHLEPPASSRTAESAWTSNPAHGARSLFALSLAAATATGPQRAAHLRLVNEGDPGPLYECDAAVCDRAATDDPSRKNRARMKFYVLPDGCVELRGLLLRPTGPAVDVLCGPRGRPMRYRCEGSRCDPLDPAAGNEDDSTRPIPLPADCGGRIHEVIVLHARRAAPEVYVECDASSGPAGESR